MRLVFLGTGSGWPTKKRNVSSIVLAMNGEVLLLDCGEGTQRQLLYTSVSFMKIDRILVTHLHGDHILGIPGLIQSMALAGRERPLEILGPSGISEAVDMFLSIGEFSRSFDVRVRTMTGGESLDTGRYVITAAEAEHTVPALAYSVEEKERPGQFDREKAISMGVPEGPLFGRLQRGEAVEVNGRTIHPSDVLGLPRRGRKVVYSGDTLPCEAVLRLAHGADVLIHEATFSDELRDKAAEFGHSTALQAAEIAHKAGVKRLFLTHISPRYDDPSALLEEAKSVFEETYMAEDFTEFPVPLPEAQ